LKIEYTGFTKVSGPLVVVEGVTGVGYGEIAEIREADGNVRTGQVIELDGDRAVVQVFEGTFAIDPKKSRTSFVGKPMTLGMSKEMLGRVFSGNGKTIDGLGDIMVSREKDINGEPINPVRRAYPRNFIETGISSIDVLSTLIRGQKLPIFSGNGIAHDRLAVQIAGQSKISGGNSGDGGSDFAVVFAAMGVKNDVAAFFKQAFEESGAIGRSVFFLNLSHDPVIERVITPRLALTAAEYLAFERGMHVLVIMTDMTAYAEALREISAAKGEIPSRKGFPGYLYSDLASMYERAGMLKGKNGSVTQIPILTMPNDDITHPIPDLTGYITEGQLVLGRDLSRKGIYPPLSILPSLSRLMKDGIGEGFTREDHPALSSQLFASYAKVQEIRALASVVGEDELSQTDKKYLKFGEIFEKQFLTQPKDENRSIEQSLKLGWDILSNLPRAELDRISSDLLNKYYVRN
jgi:V/A-type H+-transporting ATPase subunit B